MTTPQPGIWALGTRAHHHLEFALTGEARDAINALEEVRRSAGGVSGVNVVIGCSADAWTRAGGVGPEGLGRFRSIEGVDGFYAPATQRDLWVWLHGAGPDDLLDVARTVGRSLEGVAELADEQPAFVYHRSQDLTGFEDGTQNPPVEAARRVAVVAPGHPGAGGSVVLVQRWIHDLAAFESLDPARQEAVIGRTRDHSVELDPLPPDSHVGRVVIEEDGEELEIFRRSSSFGGLGAHGLYFVAFAADVARLERMLARMSGAVDGVRDALTRFSHPVSGAWYVAPSVEDLAAVVGA